MLTATTGETTTYYVFGIGLLYQEEDGETLFYHFNNIGSTEAVTDIDGKIVEKFAYGPYGELLSANECGIMYLYNGEYGVATDENGLYYMRARYYNSEIKRFVNQDVLTGTISDSPTMNRYAYVNGNPISLADPFGLSPSINWNALGHTALSVIGLLTLIPTPVTFAIGAVANIVNAAWYAAEGNYFEAVCSAVGVFGGGCQLLSKVGFESNLLMHVLKFGTAAGSIAIGGYDIYQIGYENYQSYVVRGEDFSFVDAAMDARRIVLDSVAIAGGVKLLEELSSERKMRDSLIEWVELEKKGMTSNRQLAKYRSATVAYDSESGMFYFGRNGTLRVGRDNINSTLSLHLPETSLCKYRLGNCSEVDAVNQALNNGAKASNLYLYTIDPHTYLPKTMCENCFYTFWDWVAMVLTG